jgi:Deoxyribonuclease NucA/NucB
MNAKRTYYRCVYGGLASLVAFGIGNGVVQGHNLQTHCKTVPGIVTLSWPASRYPHLRAHWLATLNGTGRTHRKWPSVYTLNRKGAFERRVKLMRETGLPPLPTYDRDELPPAFGRSTWPADVAYIPRDENRSQGASMSAKLLGYCDGTKYQFRWTG